RRAVKGVGAAVETWRIDGLAAAPRRFEAQHPSKPERLVGREAQPELAAPRWIAAAGGEGQVVLVSGEAGIGKSALIRTLEGQAGRDARVTLPRSCARFYQDTAYHPVIAHLEGAAGLDLADDAVSKREKLAQLLEG